MPPPVEARPLGFVGVSPAVRLLFERVERFAPNDAPVLITGESGTGKELIARALHHQGPRAARPFVTVNCAAFPETLLEAELFGHERGAFTGAVRRRDGRFQAADHGTLFLDEVAEMPAAAQVKLLRVLQEGVFEPLGSNRSQQVHVRVVSATHRDLRTLIEQGRFRDDLYYRLNVLELSIPPLRSRPEDLPLLVEHFLAGFGGAGITAEAFAALESYSYPGNVRELEHALQQAVVLAGGHPVDLAHLPTEFTGMTPASWPMPAHGPLKPLEQAMFEFEEAYLRRALAATGGAKQRAGAMLGVSRKCLWQKLQRHGIVTGRPRTRIGKEDGRPSARPGAAAV